MQKILVTGGTGTLGKEVVRQLLALHYKVNVLSSKENSSTSQEYNVIHGDLVTDKNLAEAVRDINVIIHCASNSFNAEKVDFIGTQNLLRVIPVKENCHFIYISIVGIDKSNYPYYQIKSKVEKLIEESGVGFSILRTTQFHDFVLRIVRSFEKIDKTIFVPLDMKFQSIDISEVANCLVELAENKPAGRLIYYCGPQVLSIEEIVQTYIEVFNLDYSINLTGSKNQLQKLFSTGINICSDNAFGKITWKEFLQMRTS